MLRWLFFVAATTLAPTCGYAAFTSFSLSDNASRLSLQRSDGSALQAPRTISEQWGYSNVQLAPNKKLIGWTVTLPNCCTSYPLPRALVVHDKDRIVRVIDEDDLSIFEWRFSKDSRSIVYFREFPHGHSPRLFRWVRVRDGKVLGKFDCQPEDPDVPAKKLVRPPKWAHADGLNCALY